MMTVPLSDVGRRGRLHLAFCNEHGRTAIRDVYSETPFKVTCLHNSAYLGIAHLILMHCTAGLFGGDALECTIHVESGARVLVTQQSSTKVHPSGEKCAVQRTRICVERGGELHLHCEPIIPFAGSRLNQTTSIDIERGGRLFFWESFMAGRIGFGEVWQFDEFSSETSLRVDGRLLHLDRFRLVPKQQPVSKVWVMGSAVYVGTGLCVDEEASRVSELLHTEIPSAGVDTPAAGLTVVRVAESDGPVFHARRRAFSQVCLSHRG
jgi:urease accessory protein